MTDMDGSFFTVGVITGTHGIRGEVKVLSRTDFPDRRFCKGSVLLLRREGENATRELRVESARPHKQFWLVTFSGLSDINLVEGFKGMYLCVTEEALMQLPVGTYYIHQLIGLRVVADDGREVGTLVDVLTPGANDVYVVRGSLQKRDVLIPAIPDCVLEVDLQLGQMKVHLMPGLLDEDDPAERSQ